MPLEEIKMYTYMRQHARFRNWPQCYKNFFMLNSTEHEISTAHKHQMKFLALSLSGVVFILLLNVKMPTIVGILTFMSRVNSVLS